jgi:hypothetical protein
MSGYNSEASTASASSHRPSRSGRSFASSAAFSSPGGEARVARLARLSTVGGFPAGTGRDTFLSWNRGGKCKQYHQPGKERRTFQNGLRGTVNASQTPAARRRPRTVSGNPTGRFRPRPPKIVHDDAGPAYGKASIQPGQFSVRQMFEEMKVTPSAHSSPTENARKKRAMVDRHVQLMKCTQGGNDPVAERRSKFLASSRRRQAAAAQWERHTSGRKRKKARAKGFRVCHDHDHAHVIDHRF